MKLTVVFVPLFIFFGLWIYAYWLVVKVQRHFFKAFPKDAANYLGRESFFGMSTNRGLFFLWDDHFISLTKNNAAIEKLRRRASRCILILITMIFLMPLSWIVIVLTS
jgi:hypothetical protein